jgi:2-polyprenyl-3-methyl-5-hydroxy-6-metoxy-1,4-benzoquinol methylase
MNGAAKNVLLVPSLKKKGGTGHLRRCARLLSVFGPGSRILTAGAARGDSGREWTPGEIPRLCEGLIGAGQLTQAWWGEWDFILFDRRETSREEFLRLSLGRTSVGLDEGGPARQLFSYLIDAFPRLSSGKTPANIATETLLAPGPRQPPRVPPALSTALVSFGGEDPERLTELTLKAFDACGLFPPENTGIVEGPAFTAPAPAGRGRLYSGLKDLLPLFGADDCVFTSFGITPYEVLKAGSLPILVNPSPYHEKLSRKAGFVSLGVKKISLKKLKGIAANPSRAAVPGRTSVFGAPPPAGAGGRAFRSNSSACPRQACGISATIPGAARGLFAAPPRSAAAYPEKTNEPGMCGRRETSLEEIFQDFTPSPVSRCPVCASVLRTPLLRSREASFFLCRDCGITYREGFPEQTVRYDTRYFFEDYRRQYGKTYQEDFGAITGFARERLAVLKKLCGNARGGLEGKTLLDIGCAYGPFVNAAREEGCLPRGIDIAEEAVLYVREKLGIPAVLGDFPALPAGSLAPEGPYHIVTLWFVIEHLRALNAALRKITEILRPGGILAFSTPNGRGVSGLFSRRKFLQNSPGDHLTIWDVRSCAPILRRFGLRPRAVRITGHHPERFPLFPRVLGRRACGFLSRAFGLGDTFEVYAEKLP